MMRVYVPADFAELARIHAEGTVPTRGAVAAEDSTEDAEYAALMEAAARSAERVAGSADPRRVVLAVDVTTPGVTAPLRDLASIHVDLDPGADPDDDLAWHATQELRFLLGE